MLLLRQLCIFLGLLHLTQHFTCSLVDSFPEGVFYTPTKHFLNFYNYFTKLGLPSKFQTRISDDTMSIPSPPLHRHLGLTLYRTELLSAPTSLTKKGILCVSDSFIYLCPHQELGKVCGFLPVLHSLHQVNCPIAH